MRRDGQRLQDILEALDPVGRMVRSRTEAEFLADETARFAVAQRLSVVGEATARLSLELRQRHNAPPWADIIGFRNILVHEYFGIRWPSVWLTATEEAPKLREQIAANYAG